MRRGDLPSFFLEGGGGGGAENIQEVVEGFR